MRLHSFHQKARLTAASAIDQLRHILAKSADGTVTQQLDLSELEDRILLSASPVAVVVESVSSGDSAEVTAPLEMKSDSLFETVQLATPAASSGEGELTSGSDQGFLALDSALDESAARTSAPIEKVATEVVFFDEEAADFEQLAADLQTQRDAGRAIDYFVLDSQRDGIDQIAETLSQYSDLDAVHIVSHGTSGAVKLGATWLRIGSLDGYAGTIAGWGSSIGTKGDILFYGCDLAANSRGEMLVDSIAALTGADVAASTDDTGSALRGGNWEIEYSHGLIESEIAFSAGTQESWEGLLATLYAYESFDYAAGTLDGQNGGVGFATAWNLESGTSAIVNATGLTAPTGLTPAQGGTLELNSGFSVSEQSRDLNTTLGIDGTTAWFSFLIRPDDVSFGGLSLEIGDGDGATNTVNIGNSGNDWLVGIDGTATGVTIDNVVTSGQTYLMAVQVDFAAGNDTITLYVDPTPGVSTPDSPLSMQTQLTTADLGTFSRIGFIGGFSGNNAQIDEIRVGETFADVTPGGNGRFLFSTSGVGNTPALAAWDKGAAIELGSGLLSFDPGGTPANTTAGNLSQAFDLDAFGGGTDLNGLHYVSKNLSVGGATQPAFSLQEGDFVVSSQNDKTLVSTNSLSVKKNDVFVIRPDSPGDYSSVQFFMLLDDPLGAEIRGVSLVESLTTLPDTSLSAGTFLLTRSGGAEDSNVYAFTATDVGETTTAGTTSLLINGADVGIGNKLFGVEFIEQPFTVGDVSFVAGQFLLAIDTESTVGNNAIAVERRDVFVLDVTATTLGSGTAAGNATLLFDGSDVGLDSNSEALDAIALIPTNLPTNQPPTDIQISSTSVDEGVDTTSGHSIGTLTATDPDASETFTWQVVGGADQLKFSIGGSGSDELILTDGVLDFETGQQSYQVDVEVTDSASHKFVESLTVTVTDLNDEIPVVGTGQSFNVAERALAGTLVGTIAASDADAGTTFSNWQITSGNTNGAFVINSSTGDITVANPAALDYSTTPSFTLGVTVSDGVNTSTVEAVAVSVIAGVPVNETIPSVQQNADVAVDLDGDYVVVWQSAGQDGDGQGIYGRRFDASGMAVSSEFLINSTTAGDQTLPRVAMDDLGNFAVTWTSTGQDGDSASETNIYVRLYDATGTALTGELLVNETTLDNQTTPAIAMDAPTGVFMITWAGFDPVGGDWNIFARRFGALGIPLTSEFMVNTTTVGDQVDPDVSVDVIAEFAIVWTGYGQDGDLTTEANIYGQYYRANGTAFGGENLINTTTGGHQHSAAIALEDDGDYTIVWVSEGQDGDGAGIYGEQIAYGGGGNNRLGEFLVTSTTAGDQTKPDISSEPTGDFVTVWQSTGQDGDGPSETNIHTRSFTVTNSTITPKANEARVHSFTAGNQQRAAVAADSEGDFVVAWDGNAPTDVDGVSSRLYQNVLVNSSPGVSLANSNLSYTENDAPLIIDAGLTASDPDDINLAGATVSFRDGFTLSEDVLSFTAVAGITGSYDAATGVLSFTGSATIASYEAVLQSVTYSNSSENPSTIQRKLEFSVTDGVSSSSDFRNVNVSTGNNDAPVVPAGQAFNVSETATAGTLLGTLSGSDPEGTALTNWQITGGNAAGVFGINPATGAIAVLDPTNLDFETTPSYVLSVTVSDGVNTSSVETVAITVIDQNDETPIITPSQSFNVSESATNGTSVGTVVATDADAGTTFSNWTITGGNAAGVFGINASTGQLTIIDRTNLDFETTPSYVLSVTVSDGVNTSSVETVAITVIDQNDETPIVTPSQSFNISESATNGTAIGTVVATDADAGTTFSNWTITGGNAAGVLGINASSGQLTIIDRTNLDFETTPSYVLSVTVSDGANTSTVETVAISVLNQNDNAPTGSPDFYSLDEGATINVPAISGVLANDSDADGLGPLTALMVSGPSNALSFSLNSDGSFSYQHDGSETTTDSFVYTVSDGTYSTNVTATLTINPRNDAPTGTTLSGSSVSENSTGATIGTLATADVDPGDSHTFSVDDPRFEVVAGNLKLRAGQSLDFETESTVGINITATDSGGASVNTAFTIVVIDTNESPSISNANFSVDEDAASGTSVGFAAGSDPDAGDTLTWSILGGNTNGAFSLNASTGELTVANPSTLDFETIPSYTLNVQIQDADGLTDTATVVVNVSDINETPTTTGLANVTVNEDSTNVLIDLTAAFADVETPSALLAYSVTGNSNPTLFASTSISGGVLTLDFAPNLSGAATITVQAKDPQGLTVSAAFNVTVQAVNDAPVASADSYAVEGRTLSVSATAGVLANDTDVEADTLTALLISGPANGSLTLQSDGSFIYEPEVGFNGVDSFSYQTFDGAATSATRTVTLNVSGKAVTPPPVTPVASTDSSSDSSESESDAEVNDEKSESADESSTTEGVHYQIDPDDGPSEATVAEDNDSDDESDAVISSDFGLTETNQDFFAMSSERLELKDATNVRSSVNSWDRSVDVSSEKELRLQDSLRFDGEDLSYLVGTEFIKELEQIEEDFEFNGAVPEWAAGTAVATTASISVGYIMWMLRGGYVLASVLSTMPVWQNIDPLPVLAALDDIDDGDDDSLETMIDRASEEADDSETQVVEEATDELRKEGTV